MKEKLKKNHLKKSNETKTWFFEKIYKIHKILATIIKEKIKEK